MRTIRTVAWVCVLALAGCADAGGGGGVGAPDGGGAGGDGGLVLDTGGGDAGAGADSGGGPGDATGDTGGSDGGDTVVPGDAAGPGDTGGDTTGPGDVGPGDAGDDAGLGDAEPGDGTGVDAGPDALPSDLPVGAPCGPDLGTCEAGASCVETGAGGSACYANLEAGAPCGPGLGACVEGLSCVTVGGGDVCATVVPAGVPCDGETNVCKAGLGCEPVGAITGFHLADTWTPDPALAPTFAPGRIARGAGGHAWVIDESVGRVVVLDPFGGTLSVVGEGTFGQVKALMNPTGVAPAPANQAVMILDAAQRFLIATLPGGAVSYIMGGSGSGANQLASAPDDVASVDAGGWVWVSLPDEDKVRVFLHTGAAGGDLTTTPAGPLDEPRALWADEDAVWVSDATGRIHIFLSDTTWFLSVNLPQPQGAPLVPADFFVDGQGWIYLANPAGGVLIVDGAGAPVLTIPAAEVASPTGVAPWWDGSFLVADAATASVLLMEPDRETVCVAPAKLGAPCGAGIGPCIAGATCVPTAPGAGSGTCWYFADSGEDCDVPFVECGDGLGCVAADTPALPSVCLPVVAAGAPCGPGVGACAPDQGCAWETPDHLARVCLPRAAVGAPCNVYGVGGCVEGASCEPTGLAQYTWACKPLGKFGTPCGPGVGSCGEGLGCNFKSQTLTEKACYKDAEKGNQCGNPQSGLCPEGTSCVWQSAAQDVAVCAGDVGPGATCGTFGVGSCTPGSTCLFTDAAQTKAQCFLDSTPVGEACGVNGLPLCAPGGDCLIDAPASVAAHCYEQKPLDAQCGAGVGLCQPGGDCLLTDVEALLGTCVPARPFGAACGEGIGLCGDGGVCVCGDPFADVCPGSVCVPTVEPGDLCVVNSVIASTGWVGFCPVGYGCVANDFGFYEGGTTLNEAHTVFFRCMPESLEGGPCGAYAGACPAGLQCLVGGLPLTLQNILDGAVGTCAP